MVSEVSGAAAAQAAQPSAAAQGWPARGAAYYGLAVIICATMLNFLDAQVFGMMAQRIKVDFHLTDEQLGFLIGPANIIFYVLVGIPMARLVDIYPRKIMLAGGVTLIGGITALGGLAQNFTQLFMSRMLVGAGGSAHAPGSYSLLADYFPPATTAAGHRLPAAGVHRRHCPRPLSRRAAGQPRGELACRTLDGPDDPRLAVGAHDGRRTRLCDRGPAAAREGTAAARGNGAGEGVACESRGA